MASDGEPTLVRMSQVRRQHVVDEDGTTLGTVLDIRVVQDGPMRDGATASLRVDGVVIGEGGLAEHLGLLRHQVRGPWLVVTLAKLVGRRARYARWEQVANPHDLGDPTTPLRVRGEHAAFEDATNQPSR